jgi:hypothetical protein
VFFFGGELRRAASLAAASAGGFKASDSPLPNEVAFELGERRKDVAIGGMTTTKNNFAIWSR